MLRRFLLKRRIAKLESIYTSNTASDPKWLLAITRLLRPADFETYQPQLARSLRVRLIRQNTTELSDAINECLDLFETGAMVSESLQRNRDHRKETTLYDFLIDGEGCALKKGEFYETVITPILTLLSSIDLYHEEDSVMYNYYSRKLTYVFEDVGIIIEALYRLALR